MKKLIVFSLVVLMIVALFAGCGNKGTDATQAADKRSDMDEVITFSDPMFEEVSRRAIQKLTGDLTREDFTDIKAFHIGFDGFRSVSFSYSPESEEYIDFMASSAIVSLEDLKYFVNLEHLDIWYLNVVNLNFIEPLNNLKYLKLEKGMVSNFQALGDKTSLEILYLYDMPITDISFVSNLKNLKELRLSRAKVKDISAVRNLESLEMLDASHNDIQDISPVVSLKSLKVLDVSYNEIQDVSVIKNMPNLIEFNYRVNFAPKLESFEGCDNLETITN